MSERHFPEPGLIDLREVEEDQKGEDHVQRCSRCQRMLADHAWLQGKIASALDARAETVPVPRPDWGGVRNRVADRERRTATGRLALCVGLTLAACIMLVVPYRLNNEQGAYMIQGPEAVIAPAPLETHGAPGGVRWRVAGGATSHASARPRLATGVSLPFSPVPTPPELDR